jgi:hypothetical protein
MNFEELFFFGLTKVFLKIKYSGVCAEYLFLDSGTCVQPTVTKVRKTETWSNRCDLNGLDILS